MNFADEIDLVPGRNAIENGGSGSRIKYDSRGHRVDYLSAMIVSVGRTAFFVSSP